MSLEVIRRFKPVYLPTRNKDNKYVHIFLIINIKMYASSIVLNVQ